MPRPVHFQRREHRRRRDAVAIDFSRGGKAGVKGGGHKPAADHANLRRQRSVQRVLPGLRVEALRQHIRMRALPRACTPLSVRPAPCTRIFSPVTMPNACSSRSWIVSPAGLTLPAAKGRAVIGDDQFQPAPSASRGLVRQNRRALPRPGFRAGCRDNPAAASARPPGRCSRGFRAVFFPAACSARCAATVERRSSSVLTSQLTAAFNFSAKARASSAEAPSLPFMWRGKPTMIRSTFFSCVMAAIRAIGLGVFATAMVSVGCASICSSSDNAMPIRALP